MLNEVGFPGLIPGGLLQHCLGNLRMSWDSLLWRRLKVGAVLG